MRVPLLLVGSAVLFLGWLTHREATPPRLELRPEYPDEATQWRLLSLRDERGQVPQNALVDAKQRMGAAPAAGMAGGFDSARWVAFGPGNVGGRVRAIATHPNEPDTLLAGSVSGGIWRSTDSGQNWAPVHDLMTNLAVTSIVRKPGNPQEVYAATGEAFGNADGIQGAGVFKSTDGGLTWAQLASTANSEFLWVSRLAFAADGSALLAATKLVTGNACLWRSTDGGSSWTPVHHPRVIPALSFDVAFHPSNPQVAVAHVRDHDGTAWFNDVLYSTDGGQTWQGSTGARAAGFDSRIELAWHGGYTGAGNGCVYALQNVSGGTLLVSTDGGANFAVVSTPPQRLLGSQGVYANALWVDPSVANATLADDTIVAGGLDLWRSRDGGATFTQISDWRRVPNPGDSAHADHHAIVPSANYGVGTNRSVYFGNDGGVAFAGQIYTTAVASGWTSRNRFLEITQFYGAAQAARPTLPTARAVIGGTQDNGTLKYSQLTGSNGWVEVGGGDGGFCAADPIDPDLFYGEYVRAQVYRSTNAGTGVEYICGLRPDGTWKPYPYLIIEAGGARSNFIAPFVIDPHDRDRMLVGCSIVWRSNDCRTPNTTDAGPTWGGMGGPPSATPISAIAIDPFTPNNILVGNNVGAVYRTLNGTSQAPTWVQIGAGTLPGRMVTRITMDPDRPGRVLVTYGGFAANNLWVSNDLGGTWSPFTPAVGTPPVPVPVRDVEVHPRNAAWLYAATEVGLLVSEDAGATWTAAATPARVSIDEMFWSDGYLYLATHGRGMFRQTPFPPTSSQVGQGCLLHGAAGGPSLSTTLPIIGAPFSVIFGGAQPFGIAAAFASLPAVPPVPISPNCLLYVDPTLMLSLATLPLNAAGAGSFTFNIPRDPNFVGRTLALQGAVVTLALAVYLTNGVHATLGFVNG